MFAFSSLFSATIAQAAFDVAIERDAANGRVNAEFIGALGAHYGLELPASPKMAIAFANQLLTLEKAPKLASGPGARAAAPAVAQAVRSLCEAIITAGKAKNLPMLAALPAWADPAQIEAKAKVAAEKRAATKAAKVTAAPAPAAVAAPAPVAAPAAAPAAVAAPATAALADSVQAVIAAARGGFLTAAQIAALRAALDTASASAASVPTKRNGGKATVTAPAVTVAEPVLM